MPQDQGRDYGGGGRGDTDNQRVAAALRNVGSETARAKFSHPTNRPESDPAVLSVRLT